MVVLYLANIHDIARKAGVSVSTVSRALNGYQDVSDITRRKIMHIAEKLNYRPNMMAKGLVTKKSSTIGLFFVDRLHSGFLHPFFNEILAAIKNVADEDGYDLLVFSNRVDDPIPYDVMCYERGVDGAIMIGIRNNDPYLSNLSKIRIPCILIDVPVQGGKVNFVETNNFEGAYQAVRYLHSLDHRRIAMINGDMIAKVSHDRLNGYHRLIEENGLEEVVEYGGYTFDGGYAAMSRLWERDSSITAVFAASDLMAMGAMEFLRHRGISIPQQVSVVGFDDISESKSVTPSLTTVKQFRYEMGKRAIEQVVFMLKDEKFIPETEVLEARLILRESCALCSQP